MSGFLKEARDQAAHFVAAALVVTLAAVLHGAFAGAAIGFALGFVRELTEGDGFGPNSRRDILFWTLGGAAAGVVFL
jgi:hypothetical protein